MNPQKIILVDVAANTLDLINGYLAQDFVIMHMVSLLPKYEKILIVYVEPYEIVEG